MHQQSSSCKDGCWKILYSNYLLIQKIIVTLVDIYLTYLDPHFSILIHPCGIVIPACSRVAVPVYRYIDGRPKPLGVNSLCTNSLLVAQSSNQQLQQQQQPPSNRTAAATTAAVDSSYSRYSSRTVHRYTQRSKRVPSGIQIYGSTPQCKT